MTAMCHRTSSPSTKPVHSQYAIIVIESHVECQLSVSPQQRPRAPQVPGWEGPDAGTRTLCAVLVQLATTNTQDPA